MGIYVAEVQSYNDVAIPGYPSDFPGTTYLSSSTYVTGPTDTPHHIAFLPRITQPALMRRDIFEGGVFGASKVAYGELVLANPDGALDFLLDRNLIGYSVIIRYGEPGAAYPSAWKTVLVGQSAGVTVGWTTLSIRIRDPHQTLAQPLQTRFYAGTNALPAGLEGTADDLKATPKPLLYGKVLNISPPCVNTSRLIYQVNDGPCVVSAVYDKGAALTAQSPYVSQADMESTGGTPAAGSYRVWQAGGYIRLGSTPAGQITCDAAQSPFAANHTAAQILKSIALKAGIVSGSISSSDVTALDAANNAELGIWLYGGGDTAQSAMDAISVSVGAWYGFDAAGTLRMQQMTAPSGTPALSVDSTSIIGTPELRSIGAASDGAFYTRVEMQYLRNWTVQQESDLAGSVTAARKAWLLNEWRALKANYPAGDGYVGDNPYLFDALFLTESAATTEINRRLSMVYGRTDTLALIVSARSLLSATIDLGSVVQVTLPRFGYDAGALFRVIGLQYDLRRNRIEMTLWR